jgi:hypothetical protein
MHACLGGLAFPFMQARLARRGRRRSGKWGALGQQCCCGCMGQQSEACATFQGVGPCATQAMPANTQRRCPPDPAPPT